MNRGRKIKQLRKFILKHGDIKQEYKRLPDPYYPPYRKGSYYMSIQTEDCNYSIGNINKYETYKAAVKDIKKDCVFNEENKN